MAYYRCGPTAIGSRASWSVTSPGEPRPLSGNFDRIFNAFERSDAFEYVRGEERRVGHRDVVVTRRMSSSFERADCALAAQAPCSDEDYYREKILYSQARQLFPLQEDLADWINKTIGITYVTGENFLDVLDNGAELCQLAAVIHDRAREALDQGLIVGPVPQIRGRCWQRAARRSFFSRDNTENFLTFCRELGVHENLLFESDDLVLHNQPRQVVLCLLEVSRLATRYRVEPPGLVQLEKEIAQEERDSGLDSAMSGAAWQFRDLSPPPLDKTTKEQTATSPEPNDANAGDNTDAESTHSDGTAASTDSDVPLRPTNELDKRVALVTRLLERGCSCTSARCSRLLKVKKLGEGRYNIAGRNVFIRLLKGRHMMVRVGGGWDTLEHFLSRHEPCQVRLVAPARMAAAPAPPTPTTPDLPLDELDAKLSPIKISPATSKTSVASKDRTSGTSSPVESRTSGSGKSSPTNKPVQSKKETPAPPPAPSKARMRSTLTLPIKSDPPRRKQSAPSFSTPNTPTNRSTRPGELRKSLTSNTLLNAPKKSRSMSLGMQKDDKPCGPDRLNRTKGGRNAPGTPGDRITRSQSLASTPVNEPKKTFSPTNGGFKKTRSASLAATPEFGRPLIKSVSLPSAGPVTQAAIEESIRLSLVASIAESECPKKPFLHIKAKYRSPPPREVPPR
ncbi:GAS2-like protein 3 [Battus philenor]|uniref:GAS2-like protein 3 n=1 Tax=Battus philenor TaxID=42288 RepID=UPI0035CEB052